MEGPSRGAWVHALATLHEVLLAAEPRELAKELFVLGETIDGTAKLRRSLADPSRDGWPKRELAQRLFAGKVSAAALTVLEAAVSGRWVTDRDLVDALERLGIDAVLAGAERDGQLDRVEDELFRFERAVSANPDLRRALGNREAPPQRKAELIVQLLSGKALPDTVWLAQRPVLHPRGRRFSAAIWRQLSIASRRRERITAIVTSAVPLDAVQRDRLEGALAKVYGHRVFVNTVVDTSVVGGILVRIGDEVVDGTVVRRLEDARRAMGA
ncbi:MAG TPA: F0F1 ATP synthase subunit delta [Dermatophilaceae bacterium]|nr:F0F1 ATP synthase subunit delta [Dermatophilaceae bacterium]